MSAKEKSIKVSRRIEKVSKVVFISSAIFSVLAILSIALYLLVASVPAIAEVGLFKFLFGTVWRPTDTTLPPSERFGILPMIVSTLIVTAGAVVIGGIVGVFSGVFISSFCPKKLKPILKQVTSLLSGLPSVVYGFFGMIVIVPLFRDIAIALGAADTITGSGILASSVVLAIMILPTVITLTVNSLDAVPDAYYLGARALGSSKSEAVFRVLIPASSSGIFAGLLLGTGRALGETMAVILVCGGAAVMPNGLFNPIRTLTANVVMEMGYADGLHRQMLLACGLVLFVFVALLTISVGILINRKGKNK